MGQCYTVYLKIKIEDEAGATKALQDRIAKGEDDHTDYSLDHYAKLGLGTEKLDDMLRIIFGGWEGELKPSYDGVKGKLMSDFDCCYGWEGVMITAFNDIAPYLKDGSYIKIYPDSGCDYCKVEGGKPVWKS